MAEVLQTAVVASAWWANKISDTANLANYRIGATNSVGNDLISLLGALNATTLAPTPEATKVFQTALQEIIMRELTNNPEHRVTLSCELSPNKLLQEAAREAGIDFSVFPFKRTMRVSSTEVLVSDGKGKAFSKLLTA
ncbi:MAG: hypothetical protein IKE91_05235 [Clostridia bacterium]|nr:hypothetical protein [Clostridia bacterium]